MNFTLRDLIEDGLYLKPRDWARLSVVHNGTSTGLLLLSLQPNLFPHIDCNHYIGTSFWFGEGTIDAPEPCSVLHIFHPLLSRRHRGWFGSKKSSETYDIPMDVLYLKRKAEVYPLFTWALRSISRSSHYLNYFVSICILQISVILWMPLALPVQTWHSFSHVF